MLAELIEEFQPHGVAVESVFTALNMKTALRLAEVRGVVLLAAAQRGIPVCSYSPREVKASRGRLRPRGQGADATHGARAAGHERNARARRRRRRAGRRALPCAGRTISRAAWRRACTPRAGAASARLPCAARAAAAPLRASHNYDDAQTIFNSDSCGSSAGASRFLFRRATRIRPARPITYRRVFKGSTPEFIEIKVSEQGKSTLKSASLTRTRTRSRLKSARPCARKFSSWPPS